MNSEWELNQSLFDIFVAIGQSKPQTYDRCVSSPRAKVPHSRCHESIVGRNVHIGMPILTFVPLAHVLLNMAGTSYKIVVFAPAWSKNRHDTQTFYVCLMHNRWSWRTNKILHQNSGKLHIHAWFLPGMVYEKEAFLRAQQKEDLTKPVALSMTSGQSSPTGQCAGNLSIPSFFMTK